MVAFWVMVAAAALGTVSALWHLPALLGPARPFGVRIPAGRLGDAGIVVSNRRYHVHIVAAAGVLAGVTGVLSGVRHGSVATIASGTAGAVVALFAIGGLCYWRARATVAGLVRTWSTAGDAAAAEAGIDATGDADPADGSGGAAEARVEAAVGAGIRQDAGSGLGVRGPARSRSAAAGSRGAWRHHRPGTATAGHTAKPGPRVP